MFTALNRQSRPLVLFVWCLLSAFLRTESHAQGPKPAKALPVYESVHAPDAQSLVLAVSGVHPETKLVGLHLVPPGHKLNVIIACTDVPRIGKPSSEGDLAVMSTLVTVTRLKEKEYVYDIQMPLMDVNGRLIGMTVELVKADAVADKQAATAAAETLRGELQARTKSAAWLFQGEPR